jgi:4-hydroxy-tetrahydrodipicolinate synthase
MTANSEYIQTMFNGSIAALVTPFTGGGDIDLDALAGLVDFHVANGTRGLVFSGTTGESPALGAEEFSTALARVIEQAAGRIPVLAGTGSASTAVTVERTCRAAELGVDAALVVTPYYNRPTQAGLIAHYRAIADEAEVPIVLYNVPGRTAVDMLPGTVEELARHDRIVGIKEAVRDGSRVDDLVRRCPPDFVILSGDDHSCLEAMRRGAAGVVSVAANVAPALLQALCNAAAEGDWKRAGRIKRRVEPLFEILMIETNPIPVKYALFEMGLIGPHIRLPMTVLAAEHHQAVRESLAALGLLQE